MDDIQAADRATLAAEAELVHELRSQPYDRSAHFRDFDGNVIKLTQSG